LNAPSGISASGITVGGRIVLQNSEFIENTTNGRVDIMPGPPGSTHYGLYVDTTSWGSGPRFGTIRSSDNALNVGGILFDSSPYVLDNVDFVLSSNGTKTISTRTSGNSASMVFGIYNSATDNGAVSIMQNNMRGSATRFPKIELPDPNLYIFARGNSSANDFIRFEHNSLNGRIISGGTSGISLEPGSGVLGISGGISATGGTFANDIRVNSMIIGRGSGNISSNITFGEEAYRDGTTGSRNVAIGSGALRVNKAGDLNTAIGSEALRSNINGRNNIAIGRDSLFSLNSNTYGAGLAEYNVAIGGNALGAATTANNNVAVGAAAAQVLTTGGNNIAIGTFTLLKCGAGNDNVAIGNQSMLGGAGASVTTPSGNVAIGASSLAGICNGGYNTAIGTEALLSVSTAFYNTAIGPSALRNITTSQNSVAIGFNAARFISDGVTNKTAASNCVYIGTDSKSSAANTTNEIVIGYNAVGLGSNTSVLGTSSTTSATIYGTLNAPSGISAAGSTFVGNIVLSGTTATAQIQFADGSTQDSSYKQHLAGPIIRDSQGDIIINPHGLITQSLSSVTRLGPTGASAYMLFLNDFYIPRGCTITRIATIQGSPTTGHTGQMLFAIYDVNLKTGLPDNLLYASAAQNLTKVDYTRYSAVPNVRLPAGSYWAGYLMDRTGVTQNMSWATIANRAFTWDAFSNGGRFFNDGTMASIRYRLSGFTLSSKLTAGFTSALGPAGNPANPDVGFGCSETLNSSSSPWVGMSIEL
jgi:hypothetical protein